MAGLLAGDASAQLALAGGGSSMSGKLEEPDHSSSNWYFSREEIEKRSPSRMDGIDLKKETYFRKSYCTFLQDLGMCLKVPQVTIATAIVFCHRFFLRQSHLKSDRHMIATICMFLAGKVEETPRPLRDVILMSYEIRHKKDPAALLNIKQKEVYEEQRELVLVGERLVLTTLGFDLNIHHPYKPLVAAIKKFKVAQNALAQVAWNFVNDGLRTSLCLQFKPHHIAAGAIFLAAKFLKVKLPSDGEKVWWQEFEVTPRQLEEVSNQMLELYEQNKSGGANASRSSEPGPSMGASSRLKGADGIPILNGHHWQHASSHPLASEKNEKHPVPVKGEESVPSTSRREDDYEVSGSQAPSVAYDGHENGQGTDYEQAYENGSVSGVQEGPSEGSRPLKPLANGVVKHPLKDSKAELNSGTPEDGQIKEELRERKQAERLKAEPVATLRKARVKVECEDYKPSELILGAKEATEARSSLEEREVEDVADSMPFGDVKVEPAKVKPGVEDEEPRKGWVTIPEVDADRVKAAIRRRKSRGEGLEAKPLAVKVETTDEEELLERELESGVEAAAEAERVRQERREPKSKFLQKAEVEPAELRKQRAEEGEATTKRRRFAEEDGNDRKRMKSSERGEWVDGDGERGKTAITADRAEDGELPSTSHTMEQSRSPRASDRRPLQPPGSLDKPGSPLKRHRDQHGRRDSHRDGRAVHTARDRDYHQSHHHHQHRQDGDRDRYHNRERDWVDRDHKKTRHDHGS